MALLSDADLDEKLTAINSHSHSAISSRNGLAAPPKVPSMAYFKFYDSARLLPLLRSQWAWFRAHKDAELSSSALSSGEVARYGLSEAEQLARRMRGQGFADWTQRDFWTFFVTARTRAAAQLSWVD